MSYKGLFIGAFLLVIPIFAFGQGGGGLIPCDGPECNACHVIQLGQSIINFLVTVAVLIAVGMFAYAGFLMVTAGGSSEQVGKAKGMFTTVVIGFIILLAGWLAVDTVMKMLYEGSELDQSTQQAFGPWNQINCVAGPAQLPPPQGGGQGGGTGGVGVGGSGDVLTHQQAQTMLAGTGISVVSTGNCSDKTKPNCTSLDGMNKNTLQQAIEIKKGCPTCDVTITGGTETGHSEGGLSHGSGYKIDINDSGSVNDFITETMIPSGTRSGDPRYEDACGNEYVKESDHWDITVGSKVCSF